MDAGAEGGQAVALWSGADGAYFSLDKVPDSCYEISVRVRADLYEGPPKLRLSVNGSLAKDPKPVANTSYKDLSFGYVCLEGGRIDANLLDDRYDGAGKDRNLYVDSLTLTTPAEENISKPIAPPPIEPGTQPDAKGLSLSIDANARGKAVRPVGLALNPIRDTMSLEAAAQGVGAKTLRWGAMEAYFDKAAAPKFKVGVQDPNHWMAWATDSSGHRTLDLPFDDFMKLAQNMGAEPILVVHIHSALYEGPLPHGDWNTIVQAAADWVEYANITQGYGVKRWEIGNEVDLNGWSPEQYAKMVKDISAAMKAVDPTIKISANSMGGKAWWDKVMPSIAGDIDFLVTHQYSWYTDYDQWKDDPYSVGNFIDDALYARDTYLPGAPLVLTEVSALQPNQATETNSVWRAVHNVEVQATALHKGVDQNYFWVSRWFGDENADMTRAFNADYQPLATGTSLMFLNRFVGGNILSYDPFVSSSVRSWSFVDEAGNLTVLMLNKATEPQALNVNLQNYRGTLENSRASLSGDAPNSTEIRITDEAPVGATNEGFNLTLPGLSVTAVRFGTTP